MKQSGIGIKLAIAGAGMTGAYLYRLLKKQGCDAHLYDRNPESGCGIKPCAWGTSAGFVELIEKAGLDAGKYILQRLDYVLIDDVRIKADLITFDKPRLIKDLLLGVEIRLTPVPMHSYDRVIDASGVCRALLPAIKDDITMECCQYLIETNEPPANRIRLGGIGYAWYFPLSDSLYHVGCGSLLADSQQILAKLGWLENSSSRYEKKILCRCSGKIRLTGPHQSLPFVSGGCSEGVWGIGEAIGCVAPLAGDGIVPGMQSVQLLLDSWDDPKKYQESVLGKFRWMKNERVVIDKLRKAQGMGLRDALVLKKNSQRMGMQVGLREAAALLKNLR